MQNNPISRRTLLKALLAGGGSVAALSFLPEHWLKPVVRTGVIPAHAASSACSAITYELWPYMTPTDGLYQLLPFVKTSESMLGQTVSWKFSAKPTFNNSVEFVSDPPLEGTGTVMDLGSVGGVGFPVLYVLGGDAPLLTGNPTTMTAQISFTTQDNITCPLTFSGVTVGLLEF